MAFIDWTRVPVQQLGPGEAPSGRDRRHIDRGEPGCTAGTGPACPN